MSRKRSFPEAILPDSEPLIIGEKRKFSPKKSKNDEIIKIDLEEDDIKDITKESDQVISLNLTSEIPGTTKTEILEDVEEKVGENVEENVEKKVGESINVGSNLKRKILDPCPFLVRKLT